MIDLTRNVPSKCCSFMSWIYINKQEMHSQFYPVSLERRTHLANLSLNEIIILKGISKEKVSGCELKWLNLGTGKEFL